MFTLDPLESRLLFSVATSDGIWTPIGPAPIAAGTTPGSLSVSGRIYAIAVNPTNPTQLYAATGGGGVWRSNDGGNTWAALTDNQATLFTGAVAIAPSNPNVIYAGTGNPTVATYSYTGKGVLKSTDGGATWALVGNSTFNRSTISQIVVSPTDPNTLYAAVSQPGQNGGSVTTGVYKSTNGGTTWTNTTTSIPLLQSTDAFTDLAIDPTIANTLYCSVGTFIGSPADGVYKSTDGGATWAPAGNFAMGVANGWTRLAISQSSPQVIYAAVAASGVIAEPTNFPLGTLYRMYRSSDGGATWQNLSNTPNFLGGSISGGTAGTGEFASAIAVSPTNPDVVFAAGASGTNSVIKSIDGGQTWTDISTGAGGAGPHQLHHGLAVDPSGDLFDADDGGAFEYVPSSNQWTSLNTTLNITQIDGVALDPTTASTAYAATQDNGLDKFTGSLSWSQKRQTNEGNVLVDFSTPQTIYHETSFGSSFIQRSTDGGSTWSTRTSGISTSDSANFYPPIAMDPTTSTRLIVGTNRVYLTTTSGSSWSPISTTNTAGWTSTAPIDSLAISKSAANTIYAAAGGDVFVTTNGGTSWTKIDPVASPSSSLEYSSIIVDPTNSQIAYIVAANFSDVTTGPHVWKTINGGTTWTNISANLPDMPVWSIALDPKGGNLYIGTDTGVYFSATGGSSWSLFATGLPDAQVRSLQFNSALNILAAGTYGRGMWEIPINHTPPTITASAFQDDTAPNTLVFQFSQNVSASLSTADLTVTNRDTGATQTMSLQSYNTATNTATFTFAGANNGVVPDGDYRAILNGAAITNVNGLAIQSNTTLTFLHFLGDANHDRAVNASDFDIIASHYAMTGQTFSHGDFNYDGVVDVNDFNLLAARFNEVFPAPLSTMPLAAQPNLFSDWKIQTNVLLA